MRETEAESKTVTGLTCIAGRRTPRVIVLGATLLLTVGAWSVIAAPADQAQVEVAAGAADVPEAVRDRAIAALLTVYQAGTYLPEDFSDGLPGDDRVAEIQESLRSAIDASFTGEARNRYLELLIAAVDRQRDGEHVISVGGGAQEIEFESADQNADSATVTGRALVFADWLIVVPDWSDEREGRAQRWNVFELHLVRQGGNWLVDEISLNAASDAGGTYSVASPRPVPSGVSEGGAAP